MTIDDRNIIAENRFNTCLETFKAKGKSYAGDNDGLYNFKVVAEMLGITPFQVWGAYFLKHVLSLTNAVTANPDNPQDKSEGNDGRVTDVINYAVLFECLVKEYTENQYHPNQTITFTEEDQKRWEEGKERKHIIVEKFGTLPLDKLDDEVKEKIYQHATRDLMKWFKNYYHESKANEIKTIMMDTYNEISKQNF